MKVLHFFKTALPESRGGIEQVINQLARGGIAYGIESDVLALSEEASEDPSTYDGYMNHRAKLDFHFASTGFSYSAFSKFALLARQADVIHYHFPWPFMDLVHLTMRIRKPTVVTYHSDVVRQKFLLKIYRPLQNYFLNSVDCIIASSPNYFATSEALNKFKEKVRVITYGLDRETYSIPSAAEKEKWRNKLGSSFFLFVGVLRYYKGLHILLDAAVGCSFPIVIAGSGPIENELRQQAKKLGLNNVIFLGEISEADKAALLELCYGVVFPSHLRSEAFGISLLEGAMFGKPMVSSEIGTGTTFINIDRVTGLVVSPSDPVSLRDAMRFLWDHPEQAAEMGVRAEARYRDRFRADMMVREYASVYRQVSLNYASRQSPK